MSRGGGIGTPWRSDPAARSAWRHSQGRSRAAIASEAWNPCGTGSRNTAWNDYVRQATSEVPGTSTRSSIVPSFSVVPTCRRPNPRSRRRSLPCRAASARRRSRARTSRTDPAWRSPRKRRAGSRPASRRALPWIEAVREGQRRQQRFGLSGRIWGATRPPSLDLLLDAPVSEERP